MSGSHHRPRRSIASVGLGVLLVVGGVPVPALASAQPAPGPERRGAGADTVLVVTHVSEGELDAPRLDELGQALREGLSRGDFEVRSDVVQPSCLPGRSDAEAGGAAKARRACVAEAARSAGANRAVLMDVQVQRRDYTIVLEVIEADSAGVAASSVQRCELCGIAEVRDVVDNQAAAIRDRLDAMTLAPPVVRFESSPPGALLRLDGKVVGETPFERVLEPGTHNVQATLDGHVDETQQVQAIEGVNATVRFDLEPVPRSIRYRSLRQFGWVALGVGVAGVVAGATLIAIDGRSNRSQCRGDNVDPVGNCKYLYATGEAGIATTVVGGALLVTAVGILIGTRDTRRKAADDLSGRGAPRPRVRVLLSPPTREDGLQSMRLGARLSF